MNSRKSHAHNTSTELDRRTLIKASAATSAAIALGSGAGSAAAQETGGKATDTSSPSNPAYVEVPGNVVARPPYVATGVVMHIIPFKSTSIRVLQKICDEMLNIPGAGKVNFRVASDVLLYVAVHIDKMTSEDPEERKKGYVSEKDIGFWIELRDENLANIAPGGMFWLPVFMFIDSNAALQVGREVFGYPKNLGSISTPDSINLDARLTLSTQQFREYGPDKRAEVSRLFAIEHTDDAVPPDEEFDLDAWVTQLAKDLNREPLPDVSPEEKFELIAPFGKIPMVFLKQFRSIEGPAEGRPLEACYQKITTVTIERTGDLRLRELKRGNQLRIWRSDSHPIGRKLALQKLHQTDSWGMQSRANFRVPFGRVLT